MPVSGRSVAPRRTGSDAAFAGDGRLSAQARSAFERLDARRAGRYAVELIRLADRRAGRERERAASTLQAAFDALDRPILVDPRSLAALLARLDDDDPLAAVVRRVLERWVPVARNGGRRSARAEPKPARPAPPAETAEPRRTRSIRSVALPPHRRSITAEPDVDRGPVRSERPGLAPPDDQERGGPPAGADPDPGEAGGNGTPPGAAHKAWGLLRGPAEVVAGEIFTLDVGLSPAPAEGVAGPALDLPPLKVQPYIVHVRIAAAGFTFPRGERRRRALPVSTADPFPVVRVRLVPKLQDEAAIDRRITAEYSIGGERLGDAIRSIRVVRTEDLRTRPATEMAEAGSNVPAPTGEDVADLTITIRASDRQGWYDWTWDSPHTRAIPASGAPVSRRVGDPAAFLESQIRQIDDAEGSGGIYNNVLGTARIVADAIPPQVWAAIHAAAVAVGVPPAILVVSEDPYVPWELAWVAEPLVRGTDAPPFLAAQARIGRWVQPVDQAAGRTRPSPNPPRRKEVAALSVIWGDYSETDWSNLDHAKQEAKLLRTTYGATSIDANGEAMFNLLRGDPRLDLLHFAVHGRYDAANPGGEDGIILTDGVLHPGEILARDLESAPVVFLNACQVAAGRLSLGTYSGVAAAFVQAGASAVIAPLWSVDDEIAGQIAVLFYDMVARGEPVSEVLRQARAAFVDAFQTRSATWMAYQLFGHPSFVITGLKGS